MRSQSTMDDPQSLGRTPLPANDLTSRHAQTTTNCTSDRIHQSIFTGKSSEFSDAELLGPTSEETAANSTSDESPWSTQGSNSTNISSFTSIEDFADKAQAPAPFVRYTGKCLQGLCELPFALNTTRAELPEQDVAIPKTVHPQFRNALSTFGMTRLGALDFARVESRSQSFTHTGKGPSIRVYRPTDLIWNSVPPWTFRRCSPAVLSQMKEAADFFAAAGSFPDAFTFYGGICIQAIIQHCSNPAVLSLIRSAIDVTRTATSESAYAFVDWLIKNYLSQETDVTFASTAEACLLHLHLAVFSAARGNLPQAAKSCRTGLQGYSKLRGYNDFPRQAQCTGLDVIMLINAKLVGDVAAASALQEGLFPLDSSPGKILIGLLVGLAADLADDHFLNMLDCADEALWKEAPTSEDLTGFETTVLFCYLWTRWQAGKPSAPIPRTMFYYSRAALLEEQTGIGPLDALSAVAALILGIEPDSADTCGHTSTQLSLERAINIPASKSTSVRRARMLCRTASQEPPASILAAFLRVYATSAKSRGSRFSTGEYGVLVRTFIHQFADSHLSIELRESVGDEPRLLNRSSQDSFSPSMSPTMASTPRSSWSGYSSFRLLHQRTKQTIPPVGSDELPSKSIDSNLSPETSSFKRRFNPLGSSLSSRSSSFSIMDVDPEDIIISDVV